jgi:NADPH2:quinone reductase
VLYTEQNFADETLRLTSGHGADLILDGVGAATFDGDLQAAARQGPIVLFGSASGNATPLHPSSLLERSRTVPGADVITGIQTRKAMLARANDVIAGLDHGWLSTTIFDTLPLTRVADTHRLLADRHTIGKILLSASEDA